MYWVIPVIVGLGVSAVIALLTDDSEKKEDMANCNKLFLDFEKKISLTSAQKARLRTSRKALEDKIRTSLGEREELSFKGFYIQGSLSPRLNTGVLKKDGTYDVDVGVYFNKKPDVSSTTVQKYILDAVADHTEAGAKHLDKCIRVVYAGDFDADLPVYYQEEGDSVPRIAIKDDGWRKDDPKGISDWFKEKKKGTNGQLVRIIKYLKIWADKDVRGFKMPSGFALTVWAAENFSMAEDRDDKALLETLKRIKSSIWFSVSCTCPKEPYDNLTDNLDSTQKDKFRQALNEFIEDAEKAISSKNQLEASRLWQKHLGDRLPDGSDEDVDAKEMQLNSLVGTILSGKAKTDSQGRIQQFDGTKNQPHRNYGGK